MYSSEANSALNTCFKYLRSVNKRKECSVTRENAFKVPCQIKVLVKYAILSWIM